MKRKGKPAISDSEPLLPLTIFRLRSDQVMEFEKEFRSEPRLDLAPPLDGYVLSFEPRKGEPIWAEPIRNFLVNPSGFSPFGQTPSAMMIVRDNGNSYVLTFGHAGARLDDKWLERDFGRRVALNAIHSRKVIEIHLEQVFAKWHVARERAPHAASVDEFGVEFDRDLVGHVEGISTDEDLGHIVRGSTSLRLKVPFSELSQVIEKSEKHFKSRKYRSHWPDIDNIEPIADEILRQRLDAQLDQELTNKDYAKRMVMITPLRRQEDDLSADSYVFGRMSKAPVTAPYLLFEGWLSFVRKRKLPANVGEAKKTAIHLLDSEKNPIHRCTAYQCFGYELMYDQSQYVLSSGVWYKVATSFIQKVDQQARAFRPPQYALPKWDGKMKEGQYNSECAKKPGFLHFDAKNIVYGGGQSKFEFCDVAHLASKTLYFAKIPNRSSGVSHLVEQVRRTVELTFGEDHSFRRAVKESMKKYQKGVDTTWLDSRPRNSDWNLCLVSLGKAAIDLPFFARCAVRRLYSEMRKRGFEVSYLKV